MLSTNFVLSLLISFSSVPFVGGSGGGSEMFVCKAHGKRIEQINGEKKNIVYRNELTNSKKVYEWNSKKHNQIDVDAGESQINNLQSNDRKNTHKNRN